MQKIIALAIIIPFLFLYPAQSGIIQNEGKTQVVEPKKLDKRAQILRDYFIKYNSPLQDQAQDFIDAADTYGVDWKLVPSIAGVESTFGKFIPGGYNGWGWGVYGTQAIYFRSWRNGIFTVTKGLKENYLDKGLKNPYEMNKVYAASPAWGSKVSFFLADLDNFAKNYQLAKNNEIPVSYQDIETKTAGTSARLSFRI